VHLIEANFLEAVAGQQYTSIIVLGGPQQITGNAALPAIATSNREKT